MKIGRDYSWWVEYSWEYDYYDELDYDWLHYEDFDSGRFNCTKSDIKKTVRKYIEENELQYSDYKNLKVKITDAYMTTTCEV